MPQTLREIGRRTLTFSHPERMARDLWTRPIGHRPERYNGADAVRCALALEHDRV